MTERADTAAGLAMNLPLLKIIEDSTRVLSEAKRKTFSDAAYRTAKGKDLSVVHWQFLRGELRALPTQQKHIQTIVEQVIAGMNILAAGKVWSDAADVADGAYAFEAAALAATASAANVAVYANVDAAYSSAFAADTLAYTANIATSYNQARQRQRDALLFFIKNAPNQ